MFQHRKKGIFLGIIYWQLGHLTREHAPRPLGPFVVFQGDRVFDTDAQGWDLGVRAGMLLKELKWRYPQAVMVPWHTLHYQEGHRERMRWLQQHAVSYFQEDPREGWWEWPRIHSQILESLMAEVIPRWALRADIGVASHPVLAQWACTQGGALGLKTWPLKEMRVFVIHPQEESLYWPEVPLEYVEKRWPKRVYEWRHRGWTRMGEVPGLMEQVKSLPVAAGSGPVSIRITRPLEGGVEQGLGEIMAQMAEELVDRLRQENQGMAHVRLTWETTQGIETRERYWPEAVAERGRIISRVLTLLKILPTAPPDKVVLEVDDPERVKTQQLNLWKMDKKSQTKTLAYPPNFDIPRRELHLQFWDIWRMRESHAP